MKIKFLSCLALLLQIVAWVPATSRPLTSPNYDTAKLPGNRVNAESSQAPYSSVQVSEADSYRGMNQLGSRPPNCEHKCDGCIPCIAIQVPTITSHLGIQYANYEPESWKCKCGPSIYSP